MQIENHIQFLLHYHDCVIIPEFGGLLTERLTASHDPAHNTISPPSKSIAFNKNLVKNDGLLINQLVDAEEIDFNEATERVHDFVDELKQTLETKNLIQLNKIGKFYYDPEDNLQFVPDRKENYSLNSFGFTEVNATIITRQRKETVTKEKLREYEPVAPKIIVDKPVIIKKTKPKTVRKRRKIFKRVNINAAVILLLTGSLVFQLVYFQDTTRELKADFFNLTAPLVDRYNEIKERFIPVEPLDVDEVVFEPNDEPVVADVDPIIEDIPIVDEVEDPVLEEEYLTEEPEEVVEPVIPDPVLEEPVVDISNNLSGHFIIIGSFIAEKNASRLLDRVKGDNYEAYIITSKPGYFRVGIGSFATSSDANSTLDELRTAYNKDAWILKN
ncbi:MAG: SPOR domain-containing protein [Bacteroidetes bacterium]|nr:SPOR domain-containing protein [Bacteroidota bacterium]